MKGICLKKREERLNQLIGILQKKNGASIRDLASLLDVSEMTVRRDVDILKEQNIIVNLNGTIILNAENSLSQGEERYSLTQATASFVKEKVRIGQFAASLIQEDECVIIDNGSTTEYLAENINKDIKMTVLTCNLNILMKIYNNPKTTIVFGGGYFHPDTSLFESPESIYLIKRTRASKVFVSAAGIHEDLGVTCMNRYELETKEMILCSGAEKILVVDSSKFGMVRPYFFAELSEFDTIITDENIPEEWIGRIRDEGITLHIV